VISDKASIGFVSVGVASVHWVNWNSE